VRTRIFQLQPLLDTLGVEDVLARARQGGHIIFVLKIFHAHRAVLIGFHVAIHKATELAHSQVGQYVVLGGLPLAVGLVIPAAEVAEEGHAHNQNRGEHTALAHGKVADPEHGPHRVLQARILLGKGCRLRDNLGIAFEVVIVVLDSSKDIPGCVANQNYITDQHEEIRVSSLLEHMHQLVHT